MIKMLHCPVILDKIQPTVHYIVNKKLSWCWRTRATRLAVNQSHQT